MSQLSLETNFKKIGITSNHDIEDLEDVNISRMKNNP